MSTKIQFRRDTITNWAASGYPVLAIGEIGVVTSGSTIVNMRMGDGVSTFENLSLLKLSFFNADDMVKTVHLQANSVTSAKLLSDASVDANRAVDSNHIKDSQIITRTIAANAVTSVKLLSDASVNANRAVESNHIKDSQVITRTIADDNVTYAKIQNVAATDKLLGRATAGAGDIEEIACTSFARTILDDVAAVNVRTTIGAKENITEPVTTGGTGNTSLAAGNLLLGAGTSAITTVAPSTSGNVLASNGSAWVSVNSIAANTSGSSASCTGNAFTSSSCTGNSATATSATTATDVTRLPVGATNVGIGMRVFGSETWLANTSNGGATFVSRRKSHTNQYLELSVTYTSTWETVISVKVVGGGTWYLEDFVLTVGVFDSDINTPRYKLIAVIPDLSSLAMLPSWKNTTSVGAPIIGTDIANSLTVIQLKTISAAVGFTDLDPNSFSSSSFKIVVPNTYFETNSSILVGGPYLKYSMVRIA